MKRIFFGTLILFVLGLHGLFAQSEESGDVYIGVIRFDQTVQDVTRDGLILLNQGDGFDQLTQLIENNYQRAGDADQGTSLYYAIHNAMTSMQQKQAALPSNIRTISIVTFTDGLDNNSTSMALPQLEAGRDFSRLSDYQNFIQSQVNGGLKINAIPVTAYGIGIQGKDVGDTTLFERSIDAISTLPSQGKAYNHKLTDYSQLRGIFQGIAGNLRDEINDVSFSMVTPAFPDGTKIRMTFDVPKGRNTPDHGKSSAVYLEGEIYSDRVNRTYELRNINYRGISSSIPLKGTLAGSFDRLVTFSFPDFQGIPVGNITNQKWVEDNIQQWSMAEGSTVWQVNSEFDPGANAKSETKTYSAVIYLVLDSSNSMSDSDIRNVKQSVNQFMQTLIVGQAVTDPRPPRVPRQSTPSDAWKNNWLYLGVRFGGGPNFYTLGEDYKKDLSNITGSFGFNAAAQISLQLASVFALQAEFMYTYDEWETPFSGNHDATIKVSYDTLLIPILAKFTFRPGNFLIAPYGGVYLSIPMGKLTYQESLGDYKDDIAFTPPLGFMLGASVGIKLGPGALFADLRYAGDFGDTILDFGHGNEPEKAFSRGKVPITIGYEIGLFRKK